MTLPVELLVAPRAPSRRDRLALVLLQIGAIAVVLIATTYKAFELDRFFVPKELVLHLSATTAALFALRSIRQSQSSAADAWLLLYAGVSFASSVLATNPWQAGRALAITISGILVFWTARALRAAGLERKLQIALAVAVVLGAVTAALQTYGVRTELFSINRAPGGTLGNRNFIAHMCAFGLPIILLVTINARRVTGFALGATGAALVAAMIVITRSRAGLLALLASVGVLVLACIVAHPLRSDRRALRRLTIVAVASLAAVVAGVLTPNTLRWRSDNPYLESVRDVANYQEGSGRGRLVQYRRSLEMTAEHPLLGVGPGNWSVVYPRFAAPRDPSLDTGEAGTTANPWPSSDWIAFLSERGIAAALLLAAAVIALLLAGIRRLAAAQTAEQVFEPAALIATMVAALVAGVFDAVLLLAWPTLLVWAMVGSLASPPPASRVRLSAVARGWIAALLVLLSLAGAVRSASQLVSIGVHSTTSNWRILAAASNIDPGNYRLHLRLARSGSGLNRASRCRHARAARALYPSAAEARRLARACA